MIAPALEFLQPALPVFDTSEDAVLLLDLHGIVQYVNGCFLDHLGFSRQEVLYSPCTRFHSELSFRFDDLLSRLAMEETVVQDVTCLDKKRREKQFRLVSTLLRDIQGQVRGVMVVLNGRKSLREQEMKHFENQRMLLSALNARRNELITIIDVQLQLTVFISNSVGSILGWRPQEYLEGGWPFEFANFHPDDMNLIALVYYREMVRRNQNKELDDQPIKWEFRRRHRTATWRWIRSESYILERDERGNIKYLISFEQDITEEKQGKNETVRLVESLLEMPARKFPDPFVLSGYSLSPREKELIGLLQRGLSAKEMALRMGLTLYTINSYKKKLLAKLNARNSAELVRIAIEHHLI
ncbi:helix-turn-helix transcriptional regulator [Candidatus Pollutiaquabacter sp.]|uniref:helix-turn-helix transcriptional regulator n=1 Tax=Candidatus Pollutiaquabacter sp. TaxID=3416354 RepID=UPI003C9756FC|nr:PAS domain-containing protein [Bacteroidota bacterium]